jgi:AraC-like DNA-binding protein
MSGRTRVPGLKLSLRSYGDRVVSHAHDFQQIVLPVTGTLDQWIGRMVGSVSLGHFAVIGRGVPHAFRACGRNCFIVLDADRPIVGVGPAIRPLGGHGTDLVRYVATELADGALGAGLEFHLSALLASKIQAAYGARSRGGDPLETAIALMQAEYAGKLTVACLAEAAGLGASQFHALFRRKTGKTPLDMLADIRLDQASTLLQATALPIAEIALAVGFSDQTALTRCFRRRRATTPNAVRREAPILAPQH